MTYMLVRPNVDQQDSAWHIDQSAGVAAAQVWAKRDISIEWEDGTIEVIPALTRCGIGGGTTADFTSLFYYIVIGQGAPTSPILAPITDIATFDTAVPDQPWGMLAVCGKWGSSPYWPLFATTPPPVAANTPFCICVVDTQAWVSCSSAPQIDRFNLDGTVYAGGPILLPSDAAPTGITVLGTTVFVADVGFPNAYLRRYDFSGTELLPPISVTQADAAAFLGTFGGYVWAGDNSNVTIIRYDSAGAVHDTHANTYAINPTAFVLIGSTVFGINDSADAPGGGPPSPATYISRWDTSVGDLTPLSTPFALLFGGALVSGTDLWVGVVDDNAIHVVDQTTGADLGVIVPSAADQTLCITVVGTEVWVAYSGEMYIQRFNVDGTSAGSPIPVP